MVHPACAGRHNSASMLRRLRRHAKRRAAVCGSPCQAAGAGGAPWPPAPGPPLTPRGSRAPALPPARRCQGHQAGDQLRPAEDRGGLRAPHRAHRARRRARLRRQLLHGARPARTPPGAWLAWRRCCSAERDSRGVLPRLLVGASCVCGRRPPLAALLCSGRPGLWGAPPPCAATIPGRWLCAAQEWTLLEVQRARAGSHKP